MKRFILLTTTIFLTLNTFSQEFSSLTVEGKAIVKQIPENILIEIEIISADPDYATCAEKLMKGSNDLQKDLVNQGVDPDTIKISNLKIVEDIVYREGAEVKLGYKGLTSLSIENKFSLQLLSTVMTTMKKGHYNFNLSVEFILSESQKQVLINLAIENSISDAILKAEIIAKSANIDLVSIKSINYNNEFRYYDYDSEMYNRVRYVAPRMAESRGSREFELNQKELAVEKTITIEWITKSK